MDKNIINGDSLTSGQLLAVVLRGWRVIVTSTLFFALTAAAIGFLMTPRYRASTLLIANESNEHSGILGEAMGQLGGLASLAGLGFGGTSQNATTEALAVLQSKQFIQEFIERNNLMPKLFPTEWDIEANSWKRSLRKVPTIFMGYKRFTGSIMDVYQDKRTNLITLVVDWTDREEAAKWANELVETLNAHMRERAIVEADQTISYLQQELVSANTVEIRAAISLMMESQLKVKAVAAVRKQYAFRVIDPAIPPDRDVVLRPHKVLYILEGTALGLLIGLATVFLIANRRQHASPI